MRGRILRNAAFLPALAPALVAFAQQGAPPAPTPERPRFFVWSDGAPCRVVPSAMDDLQTAIVAVRADADMTPQAVAQRAVDYIRRHTQPSDEWSHTLNSENHTDCHDNTTTYAPDLGIVPGHPTWNNICISIKFIGSDSPAQDVAPTPTQPNPWYDAQQNFFRQEDRLYNYNTGLGDLTDNDPDFAFPEQVDSKLKRRYRHPFIVNTGFKEQATGVTAPMRVWMQSFVDAFETARVTEGIPVPQYWFFDIEPTMTTTGDVAEVLAQTSGFIHSANSMRMIEQIYASRESTDPLHPNLWSGTIKAPGDPRTVNLRDAYMLDAVEFGLPTDQGQPDLSLFGSGVATGTKRSGAAEFNRNISLWWATMCNKAIDRVIDHCIFDVLRNKWGAAVPDLQYGNYDHQRNTGELRQHGGLTQDSLCADLTCWENDWRSHSGYLFGGIFQPHPGSTVQTFKMPSCSRTGVGLDSAGLWRMTPGTNSGQRRWGSIVQQASGNVDSPVLYPLPIASANFTPEKLRQRHLYGKGATQNGVNIFETRHETALRWQREAIESTKAGYRYDDDDRPLVPWILSVAHPEHTLNDTILSSASELSQTYALLRSHRVSGGIIYSGKHELLFHNPPQPPSSDPPKESWEMTERLIKDVYSPQLWRITHTITSGMEVRLDGGRWGALSMFNDTLLDEGEVERVYLVASDEQANETQRLSLQADFHDAFAAQGQPNDLRRLVNGETVDGHFVPGRDFFVNMECQAISYETGDARMDVTYKVYCKKVGGGRVLLSSYDGDSMVGSNRNTRGETRCYWHIPNFFAANPDDRVDPSTIYVEASSPGDRFFVKFDLLQVIPYSTSSAHLVGVSRSDLGAPDFDPSQYQVPTEDPDPMHRLEVSGSLFEGPTPEYGFAVRWDRPVVPELRSPDDPPFYVRLYMMTTDPLNPLIDMTCHTRQSWNTPNSGRNIVRVRYVPASLPSAPMGNIETRYLPAGWYTLCTSTCATDLLTDCASRVYGTLHADFAPDSVELHPRVRSEKFVFHVNSATRAPTDCTDRSAANGCVADVDDGSGDGTPDGGVTIDDMLFFLSVFEAGSPCADVDDGSGSGTPDLGVTIDDLLYFLSRFAVGC